MSDTPRTDALCPDDDAVPLSQAIPLLQLCRTLETELAAALRERDDSFRGADHFREALAVWEGEHCGGDCLAAPCNYCDGSRRTVGKGQRLEEDLAEARQMADTYKARCHALEHAVAESDKRDEEGAAATLRLIQERDEARRDGQALWMMLDDCDTADDIAKADHEIFRTLVRVAHRRRFEPRYHHIIAAIDAIDAAREAK